MSGTVTDIASAARSAGVVGAGGAGFPSHVKLGATVDIIIANGAECEPILEADKHLMREKTECLVRGMEIVREATGASRAIIGIKDKNKDVIEVCRNAIAGKDGFEVAPLPNSYPAGDEFVIILETTGRMVPVGGLPFQVGVLCHNVATYCQIADAAEGIPVTSRYVTIGGEVAEPMTIELPIGTRVGDYIEYAGGATIKDFEVIIGGPIMGPLGSIDSNLDKRHGGVIVLPKDHTMVRLKGEPQKVTKRRAKMCCTCQECTILCPRNAIGHPISPAKMMSYAWMMDSIIEKIENGDMDEFTEQLVFEAMLCCQCGVCEQYACIFGLSPNKCYAMIKDAIVRSGRKYDMSKMKAHDNAIFKYRKLPALTYARKLNLERYIRPTELKPYGTFNPSEVRIPLRQHIGAPAVPMVKAGDSVSRGDLIGEIPDNTLGARVHASINGRVESVTDDHIIIRSA